MQLWDLCTALVGVGCKKSELVEREIDETVGHTETGGAETGGAEAGATEAGGAEAGGAEGKAGGWAETGGGGAGGWSEAGIAETVDLMVDNL